MIFTVKFTLNFNTTSFQIVFLLHSNGKNFHFSPIFNHGEHSSMAYICYLFSLWICIEMKNLLRDSELWPPEP